MKEVKFKKVRTKKDIESLPFVESVFNEGEDGWWAYFNLNHVSAKMDCSMVHEHSIKELCNAINFGVRKK